VCLCRKEALTLTTGESSPSLVAGFSFFGREELSIEGFTVYTEPPRGLAFRQTSLPQSKYNYSKQRQCELYLLKQRFLFYDTRNRFSDPYPSRATKATR
jgi:hypothetical protein